MDGQFLFAVVKAQKPNSLL
jgi:hypothetical protein